MRLRLLVLFTLLIGSAAFAQRVITGSVSDAKTKGTLAGVTVLAQVTYLLPKPYDPTLRLCNLNYEKRFF